MEVPDNLQSFFNGSAKRQLKQVESLLNALSKLQVNILMPDGSVLSGNIQLGSDSAVIYVGPNAGAATTSSSSPAATSISDLRTQALTLCDGSTVTVLIAPGT